MKRKKVRCVKIYANVGVGTFNHEIIVPLNGGWSNNSLVICKNCGELFVIDWDNPATEHLSVKDVVGNQACPTCSVELSNTVADYPKTIRISEGVFGSFDIGSHSYQNEDNEVLAFYELRPI